jgi:hypothetical protein
MSPLLPQLPARRRRSPRRLTLDAFMPFRHQRARDKGPHAISTSKGKGTRQTQYRSVITLVRSPHHRSASAGGAAPVATPEPALWAEVCAQRVVDHHR